MTGGSRWLLAGNLPSVNLSMPDLQGFSWLRGSVGGQVWPVAGILGGAAADLCEAKLSGKVITRAEALGAKV